MHTIGLTTDATAKMPNPPSRAETRTVRLAQLSRRGRISHQERDPPVVATRRRHMITLLVTAALSLAATAPAATAPAGTAPAATAPVVADGVLEAFVDGVMAEHFERFELAGAAVTIVQGGDVVLSKGYGYADLATGVPTTRPAPSSAPPPSPSSSPGRPSCSSSSAGMSTSTPT
jgi:hypothetical protein